MFEAIVGAIIGGLLGLFAGAGTELVKSLNERRGRYKSERLPAIPGFWRGGGKDTNVEGDHPLLAFSLALTFTVRGTKVRGTGEIDPAPAPGDKIPMQCEGGFVNDDYMQCFYRSKDRSRKQMGVIVFRLKGESNILVGYYAGLSPTRDAFVVGNVTLTRVASSD